MKALAGVKVVSLALNLPGPACCAQLAAMGADVTTVLPPGGDPMATYCPSYYEAMHAETTQVTLNLKDAGDRVALDEHLSGADVLLTSSRPRALAKLGLAPQVTSEKFESLVRVDIVGSSREPDVAGHDLTYQAAAGLLPADADAELPRALLADLSGAQQAVIATLEGLLQRASTGRGAVREVSLEDSAGYLAEPYRHGLTGPGALLGGATPGYATYRCRDGVVVLAALEPHFMSNAASAFGCDVEELTHDGFAERFVQHPCAHWRQWASRWDVPLVALSE